MDLDIAGKVAHVLGVGGGLGSAIAASLAAEGALVAVGDRGREALDSAVARIRKV